MFFEEKVPVNREKCPWNFSKTGAREPWKVPVKKAKKVPVKACTCAWTFLRKCPWTPKSARENFRKNDVHGHFWGSREKKTLLPLGDKTFPRYQKGRFTLVFLKPREPFPIVIKWKEYSIGPLSRLPPGDKMCASLGIKLLIGKSKGKNEATSPCLLPSGKG